MAKLFFPKWFIRCCPGSFTPVRLADDFTSPAHNLLMCYGLSTLCPVAKNARLHISVKTGFRLGVHHSQRDFRTFRHHCVTSAAIRLAPSTQSAGGATNAMRTNPRPGLLASSSGVTRPASPCPETALSA